ncbi:D-alanyl-D-alanine carboxypeptidase family protein [Streptomyces violaceorubidus]|uniref:D-alanyl-D-alanine carboxypeptidase family protein n=1 Tax=Streptomyces violaceorubidus TaxID=284042 RepID=UPI003D9E45A5
MPPVRPPTEPANPTEPADPTENAALPSGPARPGAVERPHPLPRRLPPRSRIVAAGAAALITLAILGTAIRFGGFGEGTPRTGGEPGASSLPWPREGQAAVRVEGYGDLGSHGPDRPVPIASVTKVMTAYVILRDHPLRRGESGPRITVDSQAADESVSGAESTVPLEQGQRLSQRHLLELMLVPSGNNIARLLARWDAGSQEAFVGKMNRAAAELAMNRTTYTGASGLESTTTSTAADQLKLARQVMRDEVFRSVVAQSHASVPGTSRTVDNTNTLLDTPGVIGIKTGSSTPAGGALMWAVTVPDRRGRQHLALGVVLHQRAGTSPQEGLRAVFDSSRVLVEAVRSRVATAPPPTVGVTSRSR